MLRLEGRRILVTGVSRGIGLETARLYLAHGARLLGVARDAARLERARQELDASGERLHVLCIDVTERDATDRIVRAATDRWGALDVLFNNAAVLVDGAANGLEDGAEALLVRSMDVNLMAPYRLSLALLPLLRRGHEPRIVNVSSGAGTFEGMKEPGIASYRLSKWALNGLTMLLARELAGQVSVNAFDPGWVKTDLGGERAPGSPVDSANGALAVATLPFSETGKIWKDGRQISF
jgi:NAD(P)-dependent dehydrogenase (short-subunit alcohol dehydrogenase family)